MNIPKNDIVKALERLKGYKHLGEKLCENGTLLIGRAPHIAPYAWLNFIYPPLSNEEIQNLEHEMKTEIPNDYKSFLKISNGLGILHTLSLYGLRNNYKRSIKEAEQQPFSLTTPNISEKPKKAGKNIFYIGGYSSGNGAWLYIDKENNTVHLCKKGGVKSLYQWNSFDEMLSSEVDRLVRLFDSDGKKLYPNKSMLPS